AMPRPIPSLPPVTRTLAFSSFIALASVSRSARDLSQRSRFAAAAGSAAGGARLLHRGGEDARCSADRGEGGAHGEPRVRAEGADEVERRVALDGHVPERG